MTTKQAYIGAIRVVGKDGSGSLHLVEGVYDYSWNNFVDAYGIKEALSDGMPVVHLPAEFARYKKVRPLMCVFDSSRAFIRCILGGDLAKEDEEFFETHPLVGEEGVSMPNTARVVEELVAPWGVHVDRIRVAPGTLVQGDLEQWMDVLGVNPIGFADLQTDNEAFAKMTGLDLAQVNQQFRFEFSNEPLRPAIVFAVQGQLGMGHASFAGPRSKAKEHLLQLSLTRQPLWKKQPYFNPDVVPEQGAVELSLYDCLAPDGTPSLYQYLQKKQVSEKKTAGLLHKAGQLIHGPAHGATDGNTDPHKDIPQSHWTGPVAGAKHRKAGDSRWDTKTCMACGGSLNRPKHTSDRSQDSYSIGVGLCRGCFRLWWKKYSCCQCKHSLEEATLRAVQRHKGSGWSEWIVKVECPNSSCRTHQQIVTKPGEEDFVYVDAFMGGHTK